MKKEKVYTPEKVCTVCNESYDAGRSSCPKCGTANALFESTSYIKFPIEMEKALYRAIETHAKRAGQTPEEFMISALERRISELNR